MVNRKLKSTPSTALYHPLTTAGSFPELRLCGVWLEQSGFKIGEQVQITITDQKIIIKPIS